MKSVVFIVLSVIALIAEVRGEDRTDSENILINTFWNKANDMNRSKGVLDKCEYYASMRKEYGEEGGLISLYCAVSSVITFEEIETISGVNIFLSGPHNKDKFERYSQSSFAHYNPEFLTWVKSVIIPLNTSLGISSTSF